MKLYNSASLTCAASSMCTLLPPVGPGCTGKGSRLPLPPRDVEFSGYLRNKEGKIIYSLYIDAASFQYETPKSGRKNRERSDSHMARAQMFLCPENGSRTVAKARPCVNISDTCAGRYVVEAIRTFPK